MKHEALNMDQLLGLARNEPPRVSMDSIAALIQTPVLSTAATSAGKSAVITSKNLIIMLAVSTITTLSVVFFNLGNVPVNPGTSEFTPSEVPIIMHVDSYPNYHFETPETSYVEEQNLLFESAVEGPIIENILMIDMPSVEMEEAIVSPQTKKPNDQPNSELAEEKVEYVLTESTTDADVEALIRECSKHGVTLTFSKIKYKGDKLAKFSMKLVYTDNKRMTVKHDHSNETEFEWKFGWTYDDNDEFSHFYSSNKDCCVSRTREERGGQIKGEGPVIDKELDITDFTKVSSIGSFNITIKYGLELKVMAHGHENIIDLLQTDVDAGVWNARLKNGSYRDFSLHIDITMPELKSVRSLGSGDLEIGDFNNLKSLKIQSLGTGDVYGTGLLKAENSIEINNTGSGDVDIKLEAAKLEINQTGSGDIYVKGHSTFQKVSKLGSGDYDAFDLTSEVCNVDSKGSGDAYVRASKVIDINIIGSGDVLYKGPASVTMNIIGSGDVEKTH